MNDDRSQDEGQDFERSETHDENVEMHDDELDVQETDQDRDHYDDPLGASELEVEESSNHDQTLGGGAYRDKFSEGPDRTKAPTGNTAEDTKVSFSSAVEENLETTSSWGERSRSERRMNLDSVGGFSSTSSRLREDLGESAFTSSSSSAFSMPARLVRNTEGNKAELRTEYEKTRRFQRKLSQFKDRESGKPKASTSYDDILEQFSELSREMSRAVATSQRLADENEDLVGHYQKLKNEHLKLRSNYVRARKQTIEEAEARIALEQHHDDQLKRWRYQLEVKAKEFEALQLQMAPPGDLSLVEAKIRQELAAAHRADLHGRDAEIEKARNMYFAEHNELELLKTEFEQYTKNQKQEIATLKAAHEAECDALKAQMNQLRADHEEASKQETIQLRTLNTKTVTAERDLLRSQLDAALRDVEELQSKVDQIEVQHAAQLTKVIAEGKETKVHLNAERKRTDTHKAEIRRLEDALNHANTKAVQLQTEAGKLRSKIESQQRAVEEEHARGAKILLETTTKHDKERHELRAAADTLERKLTLLETKMNDERKMRDLHHAAQLDEEKRAKEKLNQALEDMQQKRSMLEKNLSDTKQKIEAQTREQIEAIDRLKALLETQESQLRRSNKEKDALQDKAKALAEQLRQVRERADQFQTQAAELECEYRTMQDRHRDLLSSEQALRVKVERADTQLRLHEEELARLEGEKLELKAKCESFTMEIIELQKPQVSENVLAQPCVQEPDLTPEYRRKLDKLERKRQKSHAMLEKLTSRVRELQSKLREANHTISSQRQRYQFELDSARRRASELEREREAQNRHISQLKLTSDKELQYGGFSDDEGTSDQD
mmetsp:Transcript_10108/g.17783  ORF Transcript_10108/g.17783 Transcript_10108/m.17783 type:complete len:841 (+) Transcript_10108:263-2785(+)|eukprot:CAMPEP_0184516082 /NCGR_PEP_ID=MMETSP0198_2-20121128/4840_1 /TAXON_ID=1112570 /ORGANISM="Thraustochytrium sp., Strain LLF1b" /LENGTH=840 /DNA_ID=CAMNT_0026906381 /DNA_START=164 /DNA_END=2686 /DNA_ORIENTATION=-